MPLAGARRGRHLQSHRFSWLVQPLGSTLLGGGEDQGVLDSFSGLLFLPGTWPYSPWLPCSTPVPSNRCFGVFHQKFLVAFRREVGLQQGT